MSQATTLSSFALPTADEFAETARTRMHHQMVRAGVLALICGASFTVSPLLPFALLFVSAVILVIWHNPKFGVFVLFFAANFLEGGKNGFPDQTTELVQFFRPLQEFTPLKGLMLMPAEVIMLLTGVVCAARYVFVLENRRRQGILAKMLLVLCTFWVFECANGLATGGNFKIAFLEVRTPAYMVVMYFLTYSLIMTARDIDILGWIILIGSGLKGLQGCFRYLVTFHGDIRSFHSGTSILEHHEAFLFNAFFFYTILIFLTDGPKPQKRIALVLLPFVFLANLWNHRRASDASTVIALIVLLPVVYSIFKERRALLARATAAFLILVGIYTVAFWNSKSAIAGPIRSIRSQISPDARDESSDAYRKLENKNLYYTIHQSQILGYGFGKEFLTPYPMVDLRSTDPYLFILPHNSILWVWMRLGLAGFIFFWLINFQWVRTSYLIAHRHRDNFVRRWAIFAILMVIINLVIAYLDMGLYGNRIQIFVGCVLGVLDRLPQITKGLPT